MINDQSGHPIKVLFVTGTMFFGEPMGVMQLSAILKKQSVVTKMIALRVHSLQKTLDEFTPDIIAYSAMSCESKMFKSADIHVQQWIRDGKKRVLRVMGGAHSTYFPEILSEMSLDAVCVGEGDRAFPELIRRFAAGEGIKNIPNILTPGDDLGDMRKELIENLDDLPFLDRDILYEAMPLYTSLGNRGFMVGRGCPYNCSYCHHHAWRELFKGCGKEVRRRSVSHVMEEILSVVKNYPAVKLVKFADDTFAYKVDDWMLEFSKRYKEEVGLPFYCVMRSNTLTEDMAKLLSETGCISMCMAVESGIEKFRNEILKRGISDELAIRSFGYARKYGMTTWGNTMLGIPGSKFEDDFNSFLFVKRLGMTVPIFGLLCPYPRTQLTDYAIKIGALSPQDDMDACFWGELSSFNCFTDKEKRMQLNLAYLGPLFCVLPDMFLPVLKILLKINATPVYKFVGMFYTLLFLALRVFRGIYPKNPIQLFRLFCHSMTVMVFPKGTTE